MKIFNNKDYEFYFALHSTNIVPNNELNNLPPSNHINEAVPVTSLSNPLKEWEENAYVIPIAPPNNPEYGALWFDFSGYHFSHQPKMINYGVAIQISIEGLNPLNLEPFDGKLSFYGKDKDLPQNYLVINRKVNQKWLDGFIDGKTVKQFVPTENEIMQVTQRLLPIEKRGKQSIGIRFFKLREQISELLEENSYEPYGGGLLDTYKSPPIKKYICEPTWTWDPNNAPLFSDDTSSHKIFCSGGERTTSSSYNNNSNEVSIPLFPIDKDWLYDVVDQPENVYGTELSQARLGHGGSISQRICADSFGVWAYEEEPALDLIFYLVFPDKWEFVTSKNRSTVSVKKLNDIPSPIINNKNYKFPWQ